MTPTLTYPGGKGGDGVYQRIISQFPPHETYVDAFVGGGAILRHKRPSMKTVFIEKDDAVANYWSANPFDLGGYTCIHGDALTWLSNKGRTLHEWDLVYLDPPYLMETRSSKKPMYRHEMTTSDHKRLLKIALGLKCRVALSGYWSQLYNDTLRDWRSICFTAQTRKGVATEYLWMNYPEPVELHDYRYLGNDYRERERIKKKKFRWLNKLRNMKLQERYALMSAIEEFRYTPGSTTENGGLR
jgi:hypothetical protein